MILKGLFQTKGFYDSLIYQVLCIWKLKAKLVLLDQWYSMHCLFIIHAMWGKWRNTFLTKEKSQVVAGENEKKDDRNTDTYRLKVDNTIVEIIFIYFQPWSFFFLFQKYQYQLNIFKGA